MDPFAGAMILMFISFSVTGVFVGMLVRDVLNDLDEDRAQSHPSPPHPKHREQNDQNDHSGE